MTITREHADLVPPLDSDTFMTLLTEFCTEFAPRRFALCEVRAEPADGRVYCWGVAFDHKAVLIPPDMRRSRVFRSAEHALDLHSQICDLRLVWIDHPDPDAVSDDTD